jgi:hypothetical protein
MVQYTEGPHSLMLIRQRYVHTGVHAVAVVRHEDASGSGGGSL